MHNFAISLFLSCLEIWCYFIGSLKTKSETYPRLYINITSKEQGYELAYYDNQYYSDGTPKLSSILISSEKFISKQSYRQKLYNLNKVEFQVLTNLVKKQEKVAALYLSKNKKEQYRIVSSSLELLFEYQKKFSKWFVDNKTL